MLTERLILRPLRRGDLPAFVDYRRDPDVARYQSWDVDYSLADAVRLAVELDGVRLGQAGVGVQTALIDRRDGSLVGDCFSHVLSGPAPCAEIGITLARARQGQGFAGEALGRLIAALFDETPIDRVFAQADDRNHAVHRLLERTGMRLETRIEDDEAPAGEPAVLRVYAVLREDWRQRRECRSQV
jgi:RimJ/RimL family protein N-acetyltransferase